MHLIFFSHFWKRFLQIVSPRPGENGGARRRNDTCTLVSHSWTYSGIGGSGGGGGGGSGGG